MAGESRDIDMVRKVRETMRAVREGGPSHDRGRCRVVAVQLSVKLNSKELDYTFKDMYRRGPAIVASQVSKVYNRTKAQANPQKKGSHGKVSISGGITEFTMTYTGSAIPVTEFKGLNPTGYPGPRRKVIKAKFLRKGKTIIGHNAPPWSEGGRYGQTSPWMYLPRGNIYGPVKRVGRGWEGATFGPSIPQMVQNRGNEEENIRQLSEYMETRLTHHLSRFGLL